MNKFPLCCTLVVQILDYKLVLLNQFLEAQNCKKKHAFSYGH